MDDENLLAVALAVVLRRYMQLRTLAESLSPEDHELLVSPEEISEAIGLIAVVRCDEEGGLAISLALPPPEEDDGSAAIQGDPAEVDSGA